MLGINRIDGASKCGDLKIGEDGAANASLALCRTDDGNAVRLEKRVERPRLRTQDVVRRILHSRCEPSQVFLHKTPPVRQAPAGPAQFDCTKVSECSPRPASSVRALSIPPIY